MIDGIRTLTVRLVTLVVLAHLAWGAVTPVSAHTPRIQEGMNPASSAERALENHGYETDDDSLLRLLKMRLRLDDGGNLEHLVRIFDMQLKAIEVLSFREPETLRGALVEILNELEEISPQKTLKEKIAVVLAKWGDVRGCNYLEEKFLEAEDFSEKLSLVADLVRWCDLECLDDILHPYFHGAGPVREEAFYQLTRLKSLKVIEAVPAVPAPLLEYFKEKLNSANEREREEALEAFTTLVRSEVDTATELDLESIILTGLGDSSPRVVEEALYLTLEIVERGFLVEEAVEALQDVASTHPDARIKANAKKTLVTIELARDERLQELKRGLEELRKRAEAERNKEGGRP